MVCALKARVRGGAAAKTAISLTLNRGDGGDRDGQRARGRDRRPRATDDARTSGRPTRRADPPRSDARLSLSGQTPRRRPPPASTQVLLNVVPSDPTNVNNMILNDPKIFRVTSALGMATGSGADGKRAPTEFPGIRRNNYCTAICVANGHFVMV